MKNRVAIDMVVGQIRATLEKKSQQHQDHLKQLGQQVEDVPLPRNIHFLRQTNQIKGMCTILQNPLTRDVDFNFYFDRLCAILIEHALEHNDFNSISIETPTGYTYKGLQEAGQVSAVVKLRGGSCMEKGLRRVIPDCQIGRMLIQSSYRTGEPELHFAKLPPGIGTHERVLILDTQMSSGGAALMAVRVLLDHGVAEERVTFVTIFAGNMGVNRLARVFPKIKVLVVDLGKDGVERWVEQRYFGC